MANTFDSEVPAGKGNEKISNSPTINLPQGGGAIRGIGEKFSVNPATDRLADCSDLYTSPGRSDFFPKLSLSYDSGSGNGPFALGWHLSIPSIPEKPTRVCHVMMMPANRMFSFSPTPRI